MTGHPADELLRQLARRREESAAASLSQFDARVLCRLTLLPEWTAELVGRLGVADPAEVPALVDRLARADLIDQRVVPGAGGRDRAFWVRTRRRREVGDHVRERLGSGLFDEYRALWSRVGALGRADLEPWLRVVDFAGDSSGHRLLDRVESLLRKRDMPSAATTIATARVVAEVLGGALEDSVKRAQWRMDREYRTKDDLAQLRGYQRRTGIERAVAELVTGAEPRWALHLLGGAGVGKTMTVRHLASGRLAAELNLPRFPVARVDFDHLDPRYPERRPAELLVAMTDELLGFATNRDAEHGHRVVRDAADALHEELSRAQPDPAVVTHLRAAAVQRFADFLAELPAPVVLVLDTCEELAKLYAPGANAPAVDRTFDLLEDLHRRAPQARVLLAGRRPLVAPEAGDPLYAGPRLLPRDYVRVEEMLGFTRSEARECLRERDVPARLHAEILRRTAEPGERHNPFELAGLCDWVRDEPDLDLGGLASSTVDPYVERRILARVHNRDVRAALPFAVALGAFDRALLAPALTRGGIDVEAAFDGLSAQEWVSVRVLGRDGRAQVVEVDEHLRDRLRAALGRAGGHPAPDLLALGRDAAELIDRVPLAEVAAETVAAAVRLLPPEESARLWTRIDERVLADREWAWALQVTPRVAAGEQARAGATGPTILAALLATEASARLHSGHHEGLVELWDAAAVAAARHPHPGLAARLTERARLGRGAAADPDLSGRALLRQLSRADHPPDAVLAVLANVVPAIPSAEFDHEALAVLDLLGEPGQPVWIRAGAAVLAGGLHLRGLSDRPVADLLDTVMRELSQEHGVPPAFSDWVVPHRLLERLRLVRVLVALYGGPPLEPATRRAWREVSTGDVDGDRLRAALLDYDLSFTADVELPESHPQPPAGPPVPWLHNGFGRPLAVAVADALAVRGLHEQAASTLFAHRSAAVAAGDRAEDVESCDLGLLRLCRSTRTLRYAPVRQLAYEGTPRLRDEAWLVLRLTGDDDEAFARYCSPFGRWRCAPVTTVPPVPPRAWAVDHLDLWEAQRLRLAGDTDRPSGGALAAARGALRAAEILDVLGDRTDEATALLRWAEPELALTGDVADHARARELLAPTAFDDSAPRPRLGARIARRWHTIVNYTIAFGIVLRRRARTWAATRTRGEIAFRTGTAVLVVGLYLGALVVLDVLPVWGNVLVGVTLGLTAVVVLVVGDVATFEMRRLAVVDRDGALSVTCYRGRGGMNDLRPPGQRLRRPMARQLWTTDHELVDGALPDTLPGLATETVVMLPVEILVVLLELPRELQPLGPWEQRIGADVPRKRLPQVVVVRQFPGPLTRVAAADWRARGETFAGPVRFRPHRELETGTRGQRLVHVLGTPVPTSAGWQLRVRDTTGQAARHSTRGAEHREELVDLQSLTREPVAFLVLQAEPVDGPPRPLGSERDGFVAAATAATDNGTDTVLVVPPLPDELVAEVVTLVWRYVTAVAPITPVRVIRIAASLKKLIAKAGVDDEQTRAACLDLLVCQRSPGRDKDIS